jgi:Lar family restriction alleviation protein
MTGSDQVALLPCPFCGSDETSYGFINAGMIMGCCECHACNACIWANTEAEAIAAWNTRALAPAVAQGAAVGGKSNAFTALRDTISEIAADLSSNNPIWTADCLADALIKKGVGLAAPPTLLASEAEVEAVARAMCHDEDAREIASQAFADAYEDSEPDVQEYWRCIARAAIAALAPEQSA